MSTGSLTNLDRVPLGVWWLDALLDRLELCLQLIRERELPPAKMDEKSEPPRPSWLLMLAAAILALILINSARAQTLPESDRYPLLDQRVPVGVWSEWVRAAGRVNGVEFQPVQVELPSSGRVTWFAGSSQAAIDSRDMALAVGHAYRLRLSDLPELAGLELYPTIELLDRLHPPAGHAEKVPLPLTFTIDELDAVAAGRMLTKVVYLEQPQFASPFELTSDTGIRTLNGRANLIAEADKAGRPIAIIRLGSRQPARGETRGPFFGGGAPLLLLDKNSTPANPGSVQQAVQFSAAQPRIELASHSDTTEICPVPGTTSARGHETVTAPARLAEQFPDEYLFDGGDRGLPVHYDQDSMMGLESEDTIAEYQDHRGRRRVKATNRVAIYAPRFAAVRTISGLTENRAVLRPTSHLDQVQGAGLRSRVAMKKHLQRDRLQGVRMRSRPGGVLADAGAADATTTKGAAQHTKLLNLFEAARFLQDGTLGKAELAVIGKSATAAQSWSRDLNPVIVGSATGGQEIYAMFKVVELVGVEEGRKRDARLRIVKLADRDAARPGDVITFTIRFDNLGDRELQFVRIIDNFTPRLEFVEDSATSDLEGSIHVDDNGEGSQILRVELDKPLAGGDGGVITFQARVR